VRHDIDNNDGNVDINFIICGNA